MMYSLHFLPEVEEDVMSGYAWYEAKLTGLGGDFNRIFYASAIEIQRNPLLYPKVYQIFRRRLVKRFPYAIYFAVEHEKITVFGLFHCARDPQSVQTLLQNREQ